MKARAAAATLAFDPASIREAVDGNRVEGRALGVPVSRDAGVVDDPSLYLVGSDGPSTAELLRTWPRLFDDGDNAVRLRRVAGAAP